MVRPRLPRSCSFRGLLAIVLLGAAGRCFMALQVRPYQQECIDKAIQENMVVSLKTGAGKTLVAVKVIDHFLEKEERHVLFVVPTKALVSQQAKYCQTHCQASPPAAELCGIEMERWDKGRWDECLRKNRLLVGTPEVFRRALDQGYLRAEQLSLIVLDECHQARGESPMANLMRLVSNAKEKPQPRVLGLTASFFCGNMKRKRDAEKAKMEMELLLGAGFLAPEVSEDAHHQSTDYEEVHWRASSYGANFESEIQPGLSRMAETLGDGADVKDFQRLGLRMNHVFKQLGRNALSSYTQHCIVPQFREKANTVMMAETVSEEERRYHKSVLERLPDLKNWARTFHPELLKLESVRSAPEISPKVDRLLQLLEQEPLKGQKGIVFVEQVSCTVPLALTISQRLGIHAEAAYGQMSRQDLNKILDRFKENETKVVVSTNALEEGIDVDSCSWVVRFDRFNTTKDHIQGSGRARASKAKIFYFDNDPQEEVSKERAMEEVAKDSRKGLTDEERRKLTEQRMPRQPTVPGIYPYTEEGGHQIHLFNGKEIVMRWCQQVLGIGFSAEPFQTEPEIRFEIPTPEGFRTFGLAEVEQHWQKVQLQEIVPTERLKEFSPRQRTELRSFYAVAVWLRKQGFLDQHHEPVVKHLELAKASCPPKKPELLLKLDGRKFERPAQALDNQRVVNYKAALQELLQQKYQTPLNELLRYSASMEDGGWIAQVTVSAEKEFSQTSHVCRTKKEAEQEAAKLAYAAYTPSTT